MNQFVDGATALGYLTAGLFFLRYWTLTQDRLFLYFTMSFWLLAFQRTVLALTAENFENLTPIYLVRLFAFVLILFAIIEKNRPQKPKGPT